MGLSIHVGVCLLGVGLSIGFETERSLAQDFPSHEISICKISGVLSHAPNSQFRIMLDYDPTNPLSGSNVAEGQTDSNGNFESELRGQEAQVFVLIIGQTFFRLWSEPGEHVRIIEKDDQTFVCEGSLAKQNQFLIDAGLAMPTPSSSASSGEFDAALFEEMIDQRTEKHLQQFEEKFIAAEGNDQLHVGDRFLIYAKAQIICSAANEKNTRPQILLQQKKLSAEDLPKNYFDFWGSFPIMDDSAAMLCRNYQRALQAKFQYLASKELLNEGDFAADDIGKWTRRELKIQGMQLVNQPLTDELLFADKLMFMIQYLPPSDTVISIGEFSKKFPTSRYLSKVNLAFAKSQSIDLSLIDEVCKFRDAENRRVSFSELNEKVIYVDFWGLWCKACMSQQPELESLAEKFAVNDDVVVLSINLDDSLETWQEFVIENSPAGIHWKPDTPADEAKAKELFLLSSLPRYMIFGKGGELISASAPAPGSTGLVEALQEAVTQGKAKTGRLDR